MSKIGVTWRMIRSSSRRCDAADHLLLGDLGLAGDVRVGARRERERALHQVEQPLVELVERDRGAVLAAAQLRAA